MKEETFAVKCKAISGTKNGRDWKGVIVLATSKLDGAKYKGRIFADDADESTFLPAVED